MSTNPKFYPEKGVAQIDPSKGTKGLNYILEGAEGNPSRESLRLKFAFPQKLEITPPELKDKIKGILVQMIDATNFQVATQKQKTVITVPVKSIQDTSALEGQEKVRLTVLIKVIQSETEERPETEFKCTQTLEILGSQPQKKRKQEPEEEKEEEEEERTQEEEETSEEETSEEETSEEEETDERMAEREQEQEEESTVGLYSGLLAVDYGTSNSSVSVRDPSFAAEEVRGQLSEEQWRSLCEWMNIWLSKHISNIEPTDLDLFVQNLTMIVPSAQIPECGSPSSEVQQALSRLDDKMRTEIIRELLMRLSNSVKDGPESNNMKILSSEMMEGFEAVIDSKHLESQRYFVLELDKNVGPAPISSVLQIVEAPPSSDVATLEEETKVDMGARVGLLFHSAALGEIDIRQFVLSSKRFFGSNDTIEIMPANSGGEVVQFPAEVLAKLTYKELFQRSIADIHKRAEEGMFQDATWLQTVVATFPTSYPASLRGKIREILTTLEIKEIDTRFDEATAAAIYYIWREIGADPVCGMHGLMARSRKDRYGRSYQNILLYDLGGGTTDIALIQLLYEEVKIFEEDEDRGNGGCYFRITPRLLGTTGHRYLGGDLLTLWVFRFLKAKLADMILNLITTKNLEVPMDNPLNQVLMDLPEEICENPEFEEAAARYRPGALLEWTAHPTQFLRNYTQLNVKVIDAIVPTRFVNDRSKVSNFFTLWEICEEIKKTLGNPIIEHFGTCLGMGLASKWPEEAEIDSGQLFNLINMIQPWLVQGGHVTQEDIRMIITQNDMNNVISDTIKQSINLAASLAKARLITLNRHDRVDRLILSGMSCNMKVIQDVAQEVFRASDGIFDYDPANVKFDRDSAKTAVSLGACIGRYMESVRVDPYNEKTRQLLYDGYDQIELVIENLFSYLPCRIAYDSLVAMVPIFEQGQELNCKSFWDKSQIVARTSIRDLRPVQEKFWIYRIDFPGAEPQYLGLIDSEDVARENGFEDFRRFREEYVVGFEADAELMIRCFFLPKGQPIIAQEYVEPTQEEPVANLLSTTFVAKRKDEEEEMDELDEFENTEGDEEPEEDLEEEDEDDLEEDEDDLEEDEDDLEEDEDDSQEGEDDSQEGEDDSQEGEDDLEEDEDEKKKSKRDEKRPYPTDNDALKLTRTIVVQEPLDELPVINAGDALLYDIQLPGGGMKKCCVSHPLSIRKNYIFKLHDPSAAEKPGEIEEYDDEKNVISKFELDDDEVEEATFVLDESGHMGMLTKCVFDIKIWAEIQYLQQKVDMNYNPFCGEH